LALLEIINSAINATHSSEHHSLKSEYLVLGGIDEDLFALCNDAEIPYAFGFDHFGLLIECTKKCELPLHNTEMQLNERLKPLIEKFGVVVFKNAYFRPMS